MQTASSISLRPFGRPFSPFDPFAPFWDLSLVWPPEMSRMSLMPSMTLSLTSWAMCLIISDLFTP